MPLLLCSQSQQPSDEVLTQFGARLAQQLTPGTDSGVVLAAIQRAIGEFRAASRDGPVSPLNAARQMELVFVHDCR